MTAITTDIGIDSKNKRLVHIIYALFAAGFVTAGVSTLIAVIIAYVKRDDMKGTLLGTHLRWIICTFWFSIIWGIVALITAIVGIGVAVAVVVSIWSLYRLIKGWLYLNDNKPMYALAAKSAQ